MDLQQLILRIGGDATGATNALNSVGAATNKFGSIIQAVVAGAAVAAMVKWTETTIQLGVEAEAAGNLLEGTMKRTLNSTNEQVAACKSWAENQEKVNHFDAELLMAQMDKAIVKYGDLGTAQVAVTASEEVARWKHMDVAAAYDQVSQASNGMARSLALYGIQAVKGTTQLEYLQQILEKAKGSTDDFNKSTAGLIEGMKSSYEVMRETLGQALLPIVNTFMTQLSPIIENLTTYIINNMPTIESKVASVCSGIASAFEAARPVLDAVWKTMSWIITNAGIAIDWINKTRTANEANDAANTRNGTAAVGNTFAADDIWNTGTSGGHASMGGADFGGLRAVDVIGNRTATRGAMPNSSDVAKGIVADIQAGVNGVPPVNVPVSPSAADLKTAADAAAKAAEAIMASRQSISDKIYALTHTDQETEQRALDQELAANIASSKDKTASNTLYTAESKALVQKYADAAKAIYQTISDKIYALTHTDFQNQQHVLDQEYAANLKNNVDKLQARALYVAGCKALEEEITKKEQEELDKRIAAQQKYQDAVTSATQLLLDQIRAITENDAQKAARDIAMKAATAGASGVSSSVINQYTSAATKDMYTEAMANLKTATTLAPGQTSFTSAQTAEIARLQGVVAQLQAAQQQYLSAPSVVKAITDMGTSVVAAVTQVAGGVGRAINGMAGATP